VEEVVLDLDLFGGTEVFAEVVVVVVVLDSTLSEYPAY